jgi:alpha-tubulin suppressor-like RCC1 family protein
MDSGDWKPNVGLRASRTRSLALRSDGNIAACGDNSHGQCPAILGIPFHSAIAT